MKLHVITLGVGAVLGVVATLFYAGQPRPAAAGSNDRHQDYVMATGAVSLNPRVQSDGVWLLDYRTGKLLGTVIDKTQGKIVGWAEVDLVGATNDARAGGLPANAFVVARDPSIPAFCLDAAHVGPYESPVYGWQVGGQLEYVAHDFASWLWMRLAAADPGVV